MISDSCYIISNVRVYDHLRCQSDSVSRYTKVPQRDTARNLMPSNWLYTLLASVTISIARLNQCYVSYLADSSVGKETALWLKEPGKGHGHFWNLLGDHRKGYATAFENAGLDGMKKYYTDNMKELASSWTEYNR